MTAPADSMAALKTKILALLEEGERTALEIRQALGIRHEAVYMALVGLEAEGLTSVWARSPVKANCWYRAEVLA